MGQEPEGKGLVFLLVPQMPTEHPVCGQPREARGAGGAAVSRRCPYPPFPEPPPPSVSGGTRGTCRPGVIGAGSTLSVLLSVEG